MKIIKYADGPQFWPAIVFVIAVHNFGWRTTRLNASNKVLPLSFDLGCFWSKPQSDTGLPPRDVTINKAVLGVGAVWR